MRSFRSIHFLPTIVIAITVGCLTTSTGLSQDDLSIEPYTVFVAEENAFTHCGPAEDYYRTDPLRYGQSLEVYAETDDGWLGIRPPEGSFCWVPAETVELDASQQHGTVIEDRTVAWIGTQLGRARSFRWQVQLAKGEPVAVIGRSEREGADGPQLWYRIVPPSGEYRWIHRDSIVMSSEELVESVRQKTHSGETPSDTSEPVEGQPASARVSPSLAGSSPDVDIDSAAVTPARHTTTSSSRNSDAASESIDENSIADNGVSIMKQDQAIGSGLREDWQGDASPSRRDSIAADEAPRAKSAVDAFQQGGLLASLEFLTRPRIREIGSTDEVEAAPNRDEIAADSNWVSGSARNPSSAPSVANASYLSPTSTPSRGPVAQTSVQFAADSFVASPSASSSAFSSSAPSTAFHMVPAERVAQVEAEARYADLDRLNLILSRLMAAQASAAEMEPVERAARNLAGGALDAVVAGRARMLAETAERYRRVATQRDGASIIQTQASQPINIASPSPLTGLSPVPAPMPVGTEPANGVMEQSGYLVQVYSARANSPPFALTDHAGRTVAYATPAPGVNLRTHLNSYINVVGTRGYLTGLNTPHVVVTQAVRNPE